MESAGALEGMIYCCALWGLFKHGWVPAPRVLAAGILEWSPRMCISNTFLWDANAAGSRASSRFPALETNVLMLISSTESLNNSGLLN